MIIKGVAAGLAAISMLASVPAQAAGAMSQAEKLRRLDIMLMVTGLRCRTTAYNFQSEYGKFTTRHLVALNAASREMKAGLAKRHGATGANRALDKLSVTMANEYGNGHPWLGCDQLKKVASGLAAAKGTAPLVEAADQLLGQGGGGQYGYARR
ncbi:hypothetical protein B0I00_0874 [Novosphingobium kunmingense]|uniref:S-adenosyl-L-homocysteine hydrolase n=1 Tax=Novosphingobium kunmingense TaxID=1211806 RepID=A0A2N0I3A3_9SPHN|nr:S-adenosyl-L-homocysteine hydrolase [Novosphingobium kunmingense]PKB25669.1 hypothetical protein B0I00_0874 [Novosphingobium kunmingense]